MIPLLLIAFFAQQPALSQPVDQREAPGNARRAQRVATARPDGNLQAALDRGGKVALVPGAVYYGTFVIRKSGTSLDCLGASVIGPKTGPAIHIAPGTNDWALVGCTATTANDQRVIQIGNNDGAQTTLDKVPRRGLITRLRIPTCRCKKGIEVNGAEVEIRGNDIADVYDPGGRDSQAVAILNTPGPVLVEGNELSAGSEPIMIGGDTMKIPDVVPSDITISNNHVYRPEAWHGDGVNRAVKNLLELKTGVRVKVLNNRFEGNWRAAQPGYAIVITPRSGGDIHDLLFDGNTLDRTAAGFNIMGADSKTVTPSPVSGVVIRNMKATIRKGTYGGNGAFIQLTTEVQDVTTENVAVDTDGAAIVVGDFGARLMPDGTIVKTGKLGSFSMTKSLCQVGKYGFFFRAANASKWPAVLDALSLTGNTFAGADPALVKGFPDNTYIDETAFETAFTSR
jgi:Right handed beta helix region